jgi:hypothetical protein
VESGKSAFGRTTSMEVKFVLRYIVRTSGPGLNYRGTELTLIEVNVW